MTGESGPAPLLAPAVLREYALIADGERGAIVGPHGDIAWMCVPRWDSPAVFTNLVGGRGTYAITPTDRHVWGGYYEPGSLIWHNRWTTTAGTVECRDALAMPVDTRRAVLLRRIIAVDGPAAVTVLLRPRAGYDASAMTGAHRDGTGHWRATVGELHLRWSGAEHARLSGRGDELLTTVRLDGGAHRDLVLELSPDPLAADPLDPETAWRDTEALWARDVPELADTLAPREARHSYAVMRGLTGASGGMVAAATTSLPERADAGRNYDYRYVWIRDLAYAGHAAAATGGGALLEGAVEFVAARLAEHGADLAPAYTTTGAPVPDQRHLELPGYPGGTDIVGNWVNSQFQLDAFGEALQLFAAAGRRGPLSTPHRRATRAAAEAISARWTEPDAGIWEIAPHHWTHSRLTAAGGLRAIAALAPPGRQAADWLALADRIVAETARQGVRPDGSWQRAPGDRRVDAALLLPALRGAVARDDPRTGPTLQACLRDLARDGYAYRFRHDDRPLGEAEGSFLLCGFLIALTLHRAGRDVDARAWFERTQAACGPPQLFSEEFDVRQRQLRGNLPQAFVHALHLEAATLLADAAPARRARG